MSFEVSETILNSPFDKPKEYWYIQEGEEPEKRGGRRPSVVFPPRDQKDEWTETALLRRSKEGRKGGRKGVRYPFRRRGKARRAGRRGRGAEEAAR
jgi:hypothetical protein